ncbi:flagellar hook-basal body complex protein [Methylobacterium sp. C25]|uniref:flagellar hook protein FlgE n=1 Tax=Methylobacterium sp. C25 TaxID=2721622 RepID=UPI001F492BCE|nr:flagellar hook-basal body complex protein [Methylobacterium sp. C25]MCE4225519.1 flagellar hook-basal body complex protein [Methylobacterium sp. C25]
MDVFTAMQTAVSGLKAQSYALDNISGNIANSQTTGYKRIDTSFVDLIAEQTARREVAGSVAAYSQLTNTIQGNLSSTGVSTNMALNGQGFFVVQKKTSDASGNTTFSASNLYTRRGDFAPDKDGYLVNGAGSYLTGTMLDPVTGQSTSNGPIKISNSVLPAKATTTITYSANLPKTPATAKTTSTAGSELLGPFADGSDPRITSGTGTATVSAANAQSFVDNSIQGPQLTAYTAAGSPVPVTTRWAKVSNADSTATPPTTDTWNLFYANSTSTTGNNTGWTNVGQAFSFNASGQLTSPTTTSITIPNLTVDGATVGNVTLDYGAGGLTEYASSTGGATTNALQQNGYSSGTLNSVDVSEDGKITGTYSNGASLTLATINVVHFTNDDGLKPDSFGNYQQTQDSGEPITGLKGTTIVGGNVEQSNTDIAGEFSKMIVTQQAYSANTRVISTAQTMMSDLINIIR